MQNETKGQTSMESTTLKPGTKITVHGVTAWLDGETPVRSEAQHIEQLRNAAPDANAPTQNREPARSGSSR